MSSVDSESAFFVFILLLGSSWCQNWTEEEEEEVLMNRQILGLVEDEGSYCFGTMGQIAVPLCVSQ